MLDTIAREMNLTDIIGRLVEKHGSINKAAIACRMNGSHLWMLSKGKRSQPTLDTLRLLANGLDVSLVDLVAMMEYGSPEARVEVA